MTAESSMSEQAIQAWLVARITALLGLETLDPQERLSRYGLDSVKVVALMTELSGVLGRPVSPLLFWRHPSIHALAAALSGRAQTESRPVATTSASRPVDEPIAVVGLACRMPGAPDVASFWRRLCEGYDAMREVPAERWDIDAYHDAELQAPGKMVARRASFVDGVQGFDPLFFGISPREAEQMDPQQRLMLELAWEVLEDAGVPATGLRDSSTGVFVGAIWHDYAVLHQNACAAVTPHTATGQALNIVANRISYALGLRGPSVTLDTACSSSLVAAHLACQSLRAGECRLALVGGVNLLLAPETSVALTKFGGLSPDGASKAFAADANGFARGEGAGMVALMPLSAAQAAGVPIYCVIRGGAVNNNGFGNGLTAPSAAAQESLLRDAYARAGVTPSRVHYVETHGPGTALGDPIEAGALGAVLGEGREAERALLIGSVKTNIGHLEGAAGIAGLLKVVLALSHRRVPPNLHFDAPNPLIDFGTLRLKVPERLSPWPAEDEKALAGVSAFGWGGTNCHLVLEEAPGSSAELLPLAAADAASLRAEVEKVAARASDAESLETLAELCQPWARNVGDGPHRVAFTARSRAELTEEARAFLAGQERVGLVVGKGERTSPRIAFVCTPQGSQWDGMGRELLHREPVFRAKVEALDAAFRPLAGWSLVEALVTPHPRAEDADVVQPLLFAVQVGLAALWRSWGVEPEVVVGHSLGEVVAACITGALSTEDSAWLVHHYSRLQQRTAGRSGMALVGLPGVEVEVLLTPLEGRVVVAGYNDPSTTVVSGEAGALDALLAELASHGVFCSRIPVNVAAHSPEMDAIREDLDAAFARMKPRMSAPRWVSTVTGEDLEGASLEASYWSRNLRQPVRFTQAVEKLAAEGIDTFVELSAHPVMRRSLEQALARTERPALTVASMRRDDARGGLLDALGALYAWGVPVCWPGTPRVDGAVLLPLSARTPQALTDLARSLVPHCESASSTSLADVAATLALHRSPLDQRLALVARDLAGAREGLEAFLRQEPRPGLVVGQASAASRTQVVFVFPGQGSQWVGMGRELLRSEPVFRAAMEDCDAALKAFVDWSLLEVLASSDAGWLERIDVVQPALFSMQVGLARLWRSWGITPDAVVGHSMGEVAAAHVAGALSLEDAARIICRRSRLLLRTSGQGAMAVTELSLDEAREVLRGVEDRLSVAASNSPRSTVLSGDPQALQQVLETLTQRQVFCRPVKVNVASHSPQMEPLRAELLELLDGLSPRASEVALHSTVLGRVAEGTELTPGYWVRNLRDPVLLSQVVESLVAAGHGLFVEVSAHPVLLPSIEQTLAHLGKPGTVLPSLRREQPERVVMLESLGRLYTEGRDISWRAVTPGEGRQVSLPTYPWQRDRYWFQPGAAGASRSAGQGHAVLGVSRRSSLRPGARFWDVDVAVEKLPYLKDHRVQGTVVLPAAAYLDWALAAAREGLGEGTWALEDVRIDEALALPEEGSRPTQLVLTSESAQGASFKVSSFVPVSGESAEVWTVHASGAVRALATGAEVSAVSLDEVRRRCTQVREGSAHYGEMEERGLSYGPTFQGLREVWRRDGEALGRLEVPEALGAVRGLHPAMLDASLQVLLEAFPSGGGTHVPVRVRRFAVSRAGTPVRWAHARLSEPVAGETTRQGDVWLLDAEGLPVAEVRGMVLAPLAGQRDARLVAQDRALFEMAWHRVDAPATSQSVGAPWLVLMDGQGHGAALVSQLEARGGTCVKVEAGTEFRKLGARHFEVAPGSREHFQRLLAEAFAEGESCGGVVYLWALEASEVEVSGARASDEAERLCGGALHLVQELTRAGWRTAPRLWLVTKGAQAVGGESRVSAVQGSLWGLGRVVSHEHPELRCTCVDVEELAPDAAASLLTAELLAGAKDEQVALRTQGRHAARLARRLPVDASREAAEPRLPVEGRAFRVEIPTPGVLDRLVARVAERRRPGRGEVEVQVEAAALNFIDVMKAMGIYPGLPPGPVSLGGECAGRVVSVGEGVTGLSPGQRVVAVAGGSLGSHVIADARFVRPCPEGMSAEDVSTVPLVFMTAWYALEHLGRLQQGERILIHSAAGGLGLAAVQVAQARGAEIFATAGTPEKREFLRTLGIAHVMDSRTLAFADEVKRLTNGEGVDVVLNSLSGDAIPRGLELLGPDGRFLEVGKRDIYDGRALELTPFRKSISYTAIDLAGLQERKPVLFARLLQEVMEQVESGALRPLPYQRFPVSRVADAFREMAQGRHTGKLVIGMEDPALKVAPARSGFRVRADGTYLVTGGLGGLGLSAARWLVEHGARNLLLMGRSAPSQTTRKALTELEALGARVVVAQADVADAEQLRAALARTRDGALPPLRGVLHCAGVLEDATLARLTPSHLRTVMTPKVRGAWNLHALTRGESLDFFVLYSSVASLLGLPGQGNYAAANAAMDSLAHHRRAVGLPATSVNWGPFSDVGLAAAQSNRGERLAYQGMASFVAREGEELLQRLLDEGATQAAAVRLDVRQWLEFFPSVAPLRVWSALSAEGRGEVARPGSDFLGTLKQAEPGARLEMLEAHLRERIAQVLRLEPSRVGRADPFRALGLDSLMSLELRNRVEASLGLKLSATLLWTHSTLGALSVHLLERLELAPVREPSTPTPSKENQERPADESAAELAALSDEHLLDLFDDALTALENES
ncbi:SDR family NAD(P)-dependent oxidoreductase [Myxococcus fulvus]|uniref:SDR family NAD(P)-dependent oxidoreductase n=1 Tax=Myxococcus fulvus TaxID=33 RepID=UPI003B9BE3D4